MTELKHPLVLAVLHAFPTSLFGGVGCPRRDESSRRFAKELLVQLEFTSNPEPILRFHCQTGVSDLRAGASMGMPGSEREAT